ncbi:MAG TPA: NUDIX hydrolase [Thermoleophilaceae bacterium]|nr:NUDIX hydrolase [Thermoleophilaceae bacterium]
MRIDRPPPGEDLNTGETTVPRASASLILLRDSGDGPEVLLVRRNPEQRFMGGAWVFPGGATAPEDDDEQQTAVRELEEEAGIELSDSHELVRFSRWITPAQVKVRFDTHFFVAEAPEDAEPTVDGSECVDWLWIRPQAALDSHRDDELMLVFPTIKHLEQLARFRTVSDVLETARASRVLPVEPRVIVEGGVAQVVLPGEEGYDDD